jgi:tripartite-type tricarboxylate transporter receptor subunit TctC
MTRRIAVIALALAACVAAIPSRSDDYPSRPVRIVFGFGPGSSGDVMSRVLAQRMSQDLGQPFIVEGKPGANGQLGATQVARAPNDGYDAVPRLGVERDQRRDHARPPPSISPRS